ncbi:MAG: DNA polymerase III subunit delta' [Gammaproteobacteria bacterium]|nr:DNA polymerase III subunit delta' [Gammaproteobacteria bacterium]
MPLRGSQLLPWHSEIWERIQTSRRLDRLPHALLLTGAKGLGKRCFAEVLAGSLLCHSPQASGEPCGVCRDCHLFNAGTHPDFQVIEPEEPGKVIKIGAIRDYTNKVVLTAQGGGFKVVLVEPADAMNRSAANSLLKTLEEPVDRTLILLITSAPVRLPATVRSRCQHLKMKMPERTLAVNWLTQQIMGDCNPQLLLDFACGAPLLALSLSSSDVLEVRIKLFEQFAAILNNELNPVVVASEWGKLDAAQVIGWYTGWLIDCLRLQADPNYQGILNPDQRGRLHRIAETIESRHLFRLLDGAYQAAQGIRAGARLNQQMMMEELLLSLEASGESNTETHA